ncbi:tetraacyldisaccharide 4'-kinase [Salegentibacter sp. F188]|uniref:Tetraacyldisaccharide 4'-kinase n=1 Tax=Autumnicola patrickiae TaxID=3075591 RepID=A0ABU3DYU6_9FLAO|nr:tetraacyldisaccharide 4'-kinase [Salegentibacter sp. F188]MDT0688891.1 tetraacyldisaccharide 4'-kinase [Salegentibacter sp. F188]
MAIFRKLLFPFSLLYDGITRTRNELYDQEILKSEKYDLPVICVGNLNTGGTGKSPMIEYLVKLLISEYRVATLSRGYKRKTSGFWQLSGKETAAEVGDEPLQFKRKFPNAIVAVDADRRSGIAELINKNAEVILLDDAFQHRKVQAGLNILLTSYNNLYSSDLVLPAGNLRESREGVKRANIVIVTKCPTDIGAAEMEKIRVALNLNRNQKLFFSYISYAEKIISENSEITLDFLQEKEFVLVTGIANPKPLVNYLKDKKLNFQHRKFPDHHHFKENEIKSLAREGLILTTEKDYVRLKEQLSPSTLFYLPIETKLIKNQEEFHREILEFVKTK